MGALNRIIILLCFAGAAWAGGFGGRPAVEPAGAAAGYAQGVSIGNLSTSFPEPSGLARPTLRENAGYLWFEQDWGGPNTITAMNIATAATAGSWTLQGVTQVDCEDLSSACIGGVHYIYFADIGNNASSANSRGSGIDSSIYRCVEPVITGSDSTLTSGNITRIDCVFPGGNPPPHRDCEGFLVDPDTGDMYWITKRSYPTLCYKLAHAASYVGTQTLTYMGKVATDTSATSTTIGVGSKTFTTVSSLQWPIGFKVCIISRTTESTTPRTNFMEGNVTACSGNSLTVNVTGTGGAGTLTDWDICMGISNTSSGNDGSVTGAAISPGGEQIVLCNYGYLASTFSGLFAWTRSKATQTIFQALQGVPQVIAADAGQGTAATAANTPSFTQREAASFDYAGEHLYSCSEWIAAGGSTNPIAKYTRLVRPVTTVMLQDGLNSYAGTVDTYIGSFTPTTDNSATTSLVADGDYATATAITNIQSFSSGTQIEVTVGSLTGMTATKACTINGCSVAAYNGTWIVNSTATTPNRVRLERAFTSTGSDGTAYGNATSNETRETMLKFDVSSIPSTATIVGVKLVLNISNEGQAAQIFPILTSWVESSTWNSLTSGLTANGIDASATADWRGNSTSWDGFTGSMIFNLPNATVQAWANGSQTNYGWLILGDEFVTLGDGFQWSSREIGTQTQRPALIISYTR